MEDVDPDDHDVFEWSLARPQFSAQFAVHLQDDFLSDGVQSLLVGDGLHDDHLGSHRLLYATQLLYGGVSIGLHLKNIFT